MRNVWIGGVMVAGMMVGCGPKTGPAANPNAQNTSATQPTLQVSTDAGDPVVAQAGKVMIRESQLLEPLKEAYGFNMLMYVVQRDMALEACREQGITVSQDDVSRERKWTLDQMFVNAKANEDREKLLDQYLAQPKPRDQMMTRVEFDIILHTNAAMRKLAEVGGSEAITEEALRKEFDESYGSLVRVRHIMGANPQELSEAKRRIEAGEDFATVARAISRNPETAREGGLLRPFTAGDKQFPENFRRVAFSLDVGEISDPIGADGSYHIVKLEEKIQQKAVKFDDVKASIREKMQNDLIVQRVKGIRELLGRQALATLKVEDPILKQEFQARLKARNQLIEDRDKIKQEMEKQRSSTTRPNGGFQSQPEIDAAPTPPAKAPAPATQKTTKPATRPAAAPADRAPAPRAPARPRPRRLRLAALPRPPRRPRRPQLSRNHRFQT